MQPCQGRRSCQEMKKSEVSDPFWSAKEHWAMREMNTLGGKEKKGTCPGGRDGGHWRDQTSTSIRMREIIF